MIILISGCSHTGKTLLAQKLLERFHYPYLSIDHLKMGLIRSANTDLTPENDDMLVEYLWPIVREMVKTAIENHQNLIVEGVYIPFDWKKDFDLSEINQILYCCLIFSERYIRTHIKEIFAYANVIERRLDDTIDIDAFIKENAKNLKQCKKHGYPYLLSEDNYNIDMSFFDKRLRAAKD